MSRMKIAIPARVGVDFDFNDARPLPFLSAPSTPKRFGDFSLSAPASPSRMAELYRYFEDFDEEDKQPTSPKGGSGTGKEDEFSFDFSAELEKSSLPADELFDAGKIRPVNSLLEDDDVDSLSQKSPLLSPRWPKSPKDIIRGVFSPRRKKDSDPFASIAVENTQKKTENERGRERGSCLTSSSCRRATRSLSPYRVAQYPWEEEENVQQPPQSTNQSSSALTTNKASTSSSSSSSSSSKGSSKRWRLKDLLLFRSASEGRASDKDPFRKYSTLFRKHEGAKNASFRSADGGSGSSKRRGQVSPHELHYTVNKAVSEDLKKRTFLPYKQGILGRLAFNPAVHALANGFGSFAR